MNLNLERARQRIAEAILRVLRVPELVSGILSDELGATIAEEVNAVVPLTRMAELEGRMAQLIDDAEDIKELYREARARLERCELELHIETEDTADGLSDE